MDEGTLSDKYNYWRNLLFAPAKDGAGMTNAAAIELWFLVFYYGPYGNVLRHDDDTCGPHSDTSGFGAIWDAIFGRHVTEGYTTTVAKWILRALFFGVNGEGGIFERYARHRSESIYDGEVRSIDLPEALFDYGDWTDDPLGALFGFYVKRMQAYIVDWTRALGGNLFNLLLQAFGVVGTINPPDEPDPDDSGGTDPDEEDLKDANKPDEPDGKGGRDPDEEQPDEDDSGSGSGGESGGENEGLLIVAIREAKPYVEQGTAPTREEEQQPDDSGGTQPVQTIPISESFVDCVRRIAVLI